MNLSRSVENPEERQKSIEDCLSSLNSTRLKQFLDGWKLTLTGKLLTCISLNPQPFFEKIKVLNLSENRISSLRGIESFASLETLSLSLNLLNDIEEFGRIPFPSKLLKLRVSGNPFESHPNHLFKIRKMFPNLVTLNDHQVDTARLVLWEKSCKAFSEIVLKLHTVIQKIDSLEPINNLLKDLIVLLSVSQENKNNEDLATIKMLDNFTKTAQDFLRKYQKSSVTSSEVNKSYIELVRYLFAQIGKSQGSRFLEFMKKQVVLIVKTQSETPDDSDWGQYRRYDLESYSKSKGYAVECLALELYFLSPNKATISDLQIKREEKKLLILDMEEEATKLRLKRKQQTDLSSVGFEYELKMNKEFFFLRFFEESIVTHFPVFPFNSEYLRNVLFLFKDLLKGIVESKTPKAPLASAETLIARQQAFSNLENFFERKNNFLARFWLIGLKQVSSLVKLSTFCSVILKIEKKFAKFSTRMKKYFFVQAIFLCTRKVFVTRRYFRLLKNITTNSKQIQLDKIKLWRKQIVFRALLNIGASRQKKIVGFLKSLSMFRVRRLIKGFTQIYLTSLENHSRSMVQQTKETIKIMKSPETTKKFSDRSKIKIGSTKKF